MLIDALNSLNITDKSEAKSVLLDIVQYSIQIMEICDLVQFCKSNLSWLLRKLYIMFNEIAAEDLESGLEKIFDFLNTKSSFVSSKEYDDSSVLEETFKNLLHSYSCTIQLISTIGFISNKSMIKLHKICIKIFNRDKTYTEYFKILESLQFLFSTPLTKFPPNYYEKVSKANSDFAKIKKNNSNRSFQEFVLIFRKILNFKLLEWTNVPKDVWKTHMSLELQEALLRLLIILMDHLKYCDVQGVKCINCNFESGHHDALQIASFGKIFIANSACKEVSLSKLIQCTTEIFNKQINSILQLRDKDCPSWNNFYDNVEKGYHKDAILLYSLGKVESSLNIFNAYMSAFAKFFTRDNQITYHATLSRVLYNMSVCQFDVLNIDEDSLKNCYLSMALNSVENKEASSKFYIQFIVKIKTKLIDVHNSSKKLCKYEKHKIVIECECCDNIENIISSNIWSVCDKIMVKNDMYRILLKNVDFMYVWYSIFIKMLN